MTFTTRPELHGTFGMVASTHWIASAVGMKMLEAGGNAFDAAVAMGFVLNVVEPHLNGPGGDLPALLYHAGSGKTDVLCAQGPAPSGATIAHYRGEGLQKIPGNGLLSTVIPGAFDGWMLMLRDHGRLSLADVLVPAIYYAETGHPLLRRVSDTIAELQPFFEEYWPTSASVWCPNGQVQPAGPLFRNPDLAATWKALVAAGDGSASREDAIEQARDAFYRGFVADRIDDYLKTASVMDESGMAHRAILTADDMAQYSATYEAPISTDYAGWSVQKCGVWSQGPVLLQSLAILRNFDIAALDPNGPEFVHLATEALKLSFADRETYLGDPLASEVPVETLLSADYAATRARLISDSASQDLVPGHIGGYEAQRSLALDVIQRHSPDNAPVYEPTMAHLAKAPGDTVHIDVVDAEGNMVSATPSGGWLQSSPIIPGLGFALNSRAQMFWLEEGLPTSLAPGRRPRTTLSPSLVVHEDGRKLAFGTPGGDQQDQWQLAFFLRHVHHGLNLQAAIDAPLFHTSHVPASFFPRGRQSGSLTVEGSIGEETLKALKARGHRLTVADEWSVGRLTAVGLDADGLLRGAATPRLMQAYAIGR